MMICMVRKVQSREEGGGLSLRSCWRLESRYFSHRVECFDGSWLLEILLAVFVKA